MGESSVPSRTPVSVGRPGHDTFRLRLIIAAACLIAAGAVIVHVYGSWRRGEALQAHLDAAYQDIAVGNGPAAEQQWRSALQLSPMNAGVHDMLGEYYLDTHQWSKGAEQFRFLQAHAPMRPHIDCRLAACLFRLGDQKDAFLQAQNELKRDKDCVTALGIVTTVMTRQSGIDQDKLLVYLKRFARLQPNDLMAQHMYAEALANRYFYTELRPELDHILAIDPDDAEAYNLKGYTDLASANQPGGAVAALADFRTSIKLAPINGGAYFGLGRAYLHLDRPKPAVQALVEASKLIPHQIRILQTLSRAYLLNGQLSTASKVRDDVTVLERAAGTERTLAVKCSLYPNVAKYPRELGTLYLTMGEYNKASYYLGMASRLLPNNRLLLSIVSKLRKGLRPVAGNNFLQ